MTTAIYAVSGDPWTNAHTNITERALQIFGKVIVAIGMNPEKRYAFPIEKRKKLAQLSVKHALCKYEDRIEVDSFEGLLADYAYIKNVKFLIRGLRDDIDFNFEKSMFKVNITQKGVDEIFLFSHPKFEHISSSAVRELQKNQGNIIDYVDLCVKQAMEVDLSGIRIFGITGQIGAGKTYVANKICEIGNAHIISSKHPRMNFYSIELDVIARNLLTKDMRPFAVEMRQNLVGAFDKWIMLHPAEFDQNIFIDIKKLKEKIFNSNKFLEQYNSITVEPIITEARHQINKPGFYLLNSALLAEGDLGPLCNNNVLMVLAPDEFRKANLKSRNYSEDELKNMGEAQLTAVDKYNLLTKRQGKDCWGTVIDFVNGPELSQQNMDAVIEKMLSITDTDWDCERIH
jgi:pantetheine-phosphate adenylyltransferase